MNKTERITNSVLAAQILLNHLSEIKSGPYFQKEIKKFTNLLLPHLVKSEKDHYDKFFEAHEKSTDEVYMTYANFINKISNIGIYDCENILAMYQAYKNDPHEMEKAVNKILQNENQGKAVCSNKPSYQEPQ